MVSIRAAFQAGCNAPPEPIAIVGIGCRFPGGVHDPMSFWRLLLDGDDAITEIPASRFDLNRFYDARPATPGKVMTRWGGFLDEIDRFDAYFFGISPREADRLDPQQRLLLEVAWEALEDGGQRPLEGRLQDTGVFVGVWLNDYEARLFRDPAAVDFYMTTGSGRYSSAGRLSYALGFQGPSLTVDTACSSSLVAVHLASQSLRSGECSLALAGGVNVILQPHITIAYSQSRMMAPDGRCKFGDERGDGYVRSEGAGVVVLKRMADALAAGDPIYATICGSAVNNDGRSSGFLATPGAAGQEDLLRKAYRSAGVSPGQVQYVEAHGTGTRAGDPVELDALGNVLAEGRPAGAICAVGSVKTNLGHTEGAAGIAGLIKVALSLKHRVLPASLHFQSPNPAVPWDRLPLRVQAQQSPWPDHEGPALAGVSAFGIAGTNAHVVLAEAPDAPELAPPAQQAGHLLGLSARTPDALAALVERCQALLDAPGAPALADLCYTAGVRRTHHAERAAFVAASLPELAAQLAGYSPDARRPAAGGARKVAFVFPGQGSQWLGMGRSLLAAEPAFRAALEACAAALRPHVDWSLLEELAAGPEQSRLHEIGVVQPALFAVQVALAALWRTWGIEPQAVIGHSLGEVAAAHVAGALSLPDAAAVICTRSRLMQEISGHGAMLAVDLPLAQAQAAAAAHPGVSVAVSNSPRSTVLAGDPAALAALEHSLQAAEVFCRYVKVDVAAHSAQMEPLRPRLEEALQGLAPAPAAAPIYSTVTAALCDGATLDAAYWGRNLRQPVLFASAVQAALADGINTFIEISPHPILTAAIEQGAVGQASTGQGIAALPSCRRQEDERSSLLRSLGDLYELGYAVDWDRLYPAGGRCVALPAYPWQREHFWCDNIPGFAGPENDAWNDAGPGAEYSGNRADSLPAANETPAVSSAAATEDWLWQVAWQPEELAAANVVADEAAADRMRSGAWLILADRGGVGEALAAQVHRAGGAASLVYASDLPDVASAARMEAMFANLFPGRQPVCPAILYLWGADAGAAAGDPTLDGQQLPGNQPDLPGSLVAEQEATLAPALHVVQAAARRTWAHAPRIWFITRGVQEPSTRSAPARSQAPLHQSPLWGLGRVAAAEYPDLWGGLIDLAPDLSPAEAARRLWPNLTQDGGGDELVINSGARLVSRLVPLRPSATERAAWRWRGDAAYLVTGGLGGLGLLLAEWLAEQGARRLILMGRTSLPPRREWAGVDAASKMGRQIAAVRRLEARGLSVHLAAVDVGDEAQLSAWLAQYAAESWPPIRGVVHAAAAVRFGLLANLTWPDLAEVLHAKVDGAWLLHKLLPELDFFVLFSSVASLLGQTGQGNYAAANAFLDALAHWRHSQALPALSINWAVWAQTGIAAAESSAPVTQHLAQQGVGEIEPAAGIALLRRLIDSGAAEVAVLPPVAPAAAALPRLLAERQARQVEAGEASPAAPTSQNESLRDVLLALEPAQRRSKLAAYLQAAVGQVLRMAPGRVGLAVAFGSLGLDSLMALELRNRLEAGLQISLPATFAWNYPTVDELLPYLAARMDVRLGESAPDLPVAGSLRPVETDLQAQREAGLDPGDAQIAGLGDLLANIQDLSDEGALHLLKTQQR